ncbi:hypothetical protein [Streptomyces sp. NPDC086182]|jgi:hypothetical protein|uniref:DUF6197 family protein n=1 Tax=Streptomyces sp. NPDC086182 TaxID=3155058 RepID=UPI003412ED68
MTTPTLTQASPPTAAPALDLDARMALRLAEMNERCALAVLAVDVNSAHITVPELPTVTAPLPLTPTAAPCPYPTPVAATLHRARLRLDAGGWCTGQLRDEQGAACLIGAIRTEAPGRGAADDACVILLEAIRRDFPTAETVPSWNDNQRDPRLPARYLDRAAELAHARGL